MSVIFFVHGAVFASWAARVPAVREELDLPAGVLGVVLAGPGLGALAGSQLGGLLVHSTGSRAVSAAAPVALGVPLALVPAADSAWPLMSVLMVLGAADGCTSVAMNAQAVVVQRQYGRPVINSMHAVRSVGAVAGGLAGAATAASGLTLAQQFVLMAAVLAVLSAAAAAGLLPDPKRDRDRGGAQEERGDPGPRGTPAADGKDDPPAHRGGRTTVLLALMVFLAALVSDAPASWGGVYVRELGADAATAAAAYAAFSSGEVAARVVNDKLVHRFGWVRLIRVGTAGCAVVLAAAFVAGRPVLALAGFAVAGAGVSAVFPGAFTAAGALPRPAPAMGQLNFAGNLGWLLVSPLVGGLAALAGLPAAMGVLVAAASAVAALAGVVRHGTRRSGG